MDNASFFFSFEFDLPQTALELLFGGLRKLGGQALQKTLAALAFIVQNELCLPLKDSPYHHTRSGRDWPDMWRYQKVTARSTESRGISPSGFGSILTRVEFDEQKDKVVERLAAIGAGDRATSSIIRTPQPGQYHMPPTLNDSR